MLHRTFLMSFLSLCCLGSPTYADIFVTYGTEEGGIRYIDLMPNTPNQSVEFYATGIVAEGGSNGFELNLQIGDGGAIFGGRDTEPVMTSIDLLTDTIWMDHRPTQTDVEVHPLARQSTVDTVSLAIVNGLIGTVVIDTTGFLDGEIDFLLTGVGGEYHTSLFQGTEILTTIAPNGVIRIDAGESIPEPAGTVVIVLGLTGLVFRRHRSRQ